MRVQKKQYENLEYKEVKKAMEEAAELIKDPEMKELAEE